VHHSKSGRQCRSWVMGRRKGCVRVQSAAHSRTVIRGTRRHSHFGRVEDGRGSLGHAATLRFPSPLIEPDVRISRIRSPTGFTARHTEEITDRCGVFLPSPCDSEAMRGDGQAAFGISYLADVLALIYPIASSLGGGETFGLASRSRLFGVEWARKLTSRGGNVALRGAPRSPHPLRGTLCATSTAFAWPRDFYTPWVKQCV
jgi:hypothetical protein